MCNVVLNLFKQEGEDNSELTNWLLIFLSQLDQQIDRFDTKYIHESPRESFLIEETKMP